MTKSVAETERGVDAWTVDSLAEALGVDRKYAAEALEQSVRDGRATMLVCGDQVLFVQGALTVRLNDLGIVAVEGERFAARRGLMRRLRVRSRVRDLGEGAS